MSPSEYDRIVRRMVEAAGHASQSMGLGRVVGQIYACLYFSQEPRTLDDLTSAWAGLPCSGRLPAEVDQH